MGFQSIPVSEPDRYTSPWVTPTPLTTASVLSLRQQMDESNHDMVNLLTQQIGTFFNPLIQNTNDSYQMLAYQMGCTTFLVLLPLKLSLGLIRLHHK
jgi:hypothetical protein